nr:uncharacterized mitochondrial protein AtMg00810-like [Tanacetum cinerariifolium]
MAGEDTSQPPPPPIASTEAPQMVSSVKLPILKKGEYILWTMKMEQYLAHTDYALWKVILNGNSAVQMTKDKAGNEVEVPPVTAHQILARTRERKAKSTLLMDILDEHLARFHGIKDAKTLWAAIKTGFGAWSNISLITRNKPGIDNLDINDLYNNLKVYEADIKGFSGSSSNSQNVAFVSAESTSNTNELNAAYSISTATDHSSQAQGSSSYTDELMFLFFANQSSSPQLDNKDLEQIDQDDLEEIDLKWKVAMLSMRVKRFYKKIGRKLKFNGKEPVGFDKTKVKCFNYHRIGHFTRDCKTARNSGNMSRDAGNAGYKGRDNVKEEVTDFALMAFTSNPSSSSSSNFELSSKAKLVSSISQPLQMLHMDLFGPISVMSINHKKYYLVVTDDFSRTLVTKSHNKTPYELFNGRTPRLDFMRPFSSHVTILNTLDPLGNFKGKADEGFLVGYFVTSKAFRVFNTKTRKFEENMHVRFLENKLNVDGIGPNWLFDIDSLTNSMNYIPVSVENQTEKNAGLQDTNGNVGTQDNVDAGKEVSDQHYIVFSLWSSIFSTFKSLDDKATDDKPKNDTGSKAVEDPVNKEDQAYRDDLDRLMSQEKEASDAADALRKEFEQECMDQRGATKDGSTNSFNTVSSPVNVASTSGTFSAGGPSSPHPDAFIPTNTILHVKQSEKGIFISQDKYIAEILKKFHFSSVKIASTPIETQKPLVKDKEAADVDVHLYRSMIGSLMYLTTSRPDIMFVVCAFSRFQVTPLLHLHAVKQIFRYLKGQPKLGLWYPRYSPFDLESYSDSDYAGANLDRKSTTGGCQFLGRRLILWQCKKQTIVATFTTEAEYVAAANCCGQFIDPPLSTHYTVGSEENRMEHNIELTDPVPQIPYKSPLSGGHKPGSDEGSMKLKELIDFCTTLLQKIHDLENVKTAQAKEIASVKKRVTKLEQRQSLRILGFHPFRVGTSKRHSFGRRKFIDPPLSTHYTVGSEENRMEHNIELTDPVPQIPYKSPLSGGHKPGSDEGSMKLKELIDFCTTLLQKIHDLENVKTAQAKEIASVKKRVTKLEQRQSLRILGFHPFRVGTSKRHSFDEDVDTKMIVEDKGNGEKGGSTAETVSTARPDIRAARPEISTVEPPTTSTLFDDKDVTIADTLVKMKNQKAKEKIAFKDADDSVRPIRSITTLQPLPIIDPKDKGKGILQKPKPIKKTKKKDQDQIKRDAEVALKIQSHLDEEAKTKRERQEEASKAALAEMYDEVQAQIDVDYELAVILTHEEQEKYTVERFTHAQLKSRSFEEIQKLYIKEQKWVDAFVPIGSKEDEKRIGSRKKRAAGSSSKHKSPKKQK